MKAASTCRVGAVEVMAMIATEDTLKLRLLRAAVKSPTEPDGVHASALPSSGGLITASLR